MSARHGQAIVNTVGWARSHTHLVAWFSRVRLWHCLNPLSFGRDMVELENLCRWFRRAVVGGCSAARCRHLPISVHCRTVFFPRPASTLQYSLFPSPLPEPSYGSRNQRIFGMDRMSESGPLRQLQQRRHIYPLTQRRFSRGTFHSSSLRF
jgi:hypothetical protein